MTNYSFTREAGEEALKAKTIKLFKALWFNYYEVVNMNIYAWGADVDGTVTQTPGGNPVVSVVKYIEQLDESFNGISDEVKKRLTGCKSTDEKIASAYDVLGEFKVPMKTLYAATDVVTNETSVIEPFGDAIKKYQPEVFFLVSYSDYMTIDHIKRKILEPLSPKTKFVTIATLLGEDEKGIIKKRAEEMYGSRERAWMPINLYKMGVFGNVLFFGDNERNGVNNAMLENSDIGFRYDDSLDNIEIEGNIIHTPHKKMMEALDLVYNGLSNPKRSSPYERSQLIIDLEKIPERKKKELDLPELMITSV